MASAGARTTDEWRSRTKALLRAVTRSSAFDCRRGLFGARRVLAGRSYVHLWPFACAWSALETASSLGGDVGARAATAAAACASGIAAYAPDESYATAGGASQSTTTIGFESTVTAPLGPGGEIYYDDNAWVALALLAHHQHDGHAGALGLARRVLGFCCSGWSTERGWCHPGGIRWKVPVTNRSRNTCANGPVAAAAASIHLLDGDDRALQWAVDIYSWVRAALLGSDHLYADHIMPDGTKTEVRWSYNQGTMIGAGVFLATATGDASYIAHARATATASLGRYDAHALMSTGSPSFNAIFFRNALLLDQIEPDPRLRALASEYATRMWASFARPARHRRICRRSIRARQTGGGPRIADLGAAAEICALLAGAAPHA